MCTAGYMTVWYGHSVASGTFAFFVIDVNWLIVAHMTHLLRFNPTAPWTDGFAAVCAWSRCSRPVLAPTHAGATWARWVFFIVRGREPFTKGSTASVAVRCLVFPPVFYVRRFCCPRVWSFRSRSGQRLQCTTPICRRLPPCCKNTKKEQRVKAREGRKDAGVQWEALEKT